MRPIITDEEMLTVLMCGFQDKSNAMSNSGSLLGYNMAPLKRQGILERLPDQTRINCPWCGHEKWVKIKETAKGDKEYYCMCKKCRPTKISPETLYMWEIKRNPFLRLLVKAYGIEGGIQETQDGVWKLGRKGNTPYWLIRDCRPGQEQQNLIQQFKTSTHSVIMTFMCNTANLLTPFLPNPVIILNDVTSLNESGEFVFKPIESECDIPVPAKNTRNTSRRAGRLTSIETIIQVLEAHILESYAYLQKTAENHNADILPPLSQADLVRKTGIPKWKISRCLSDPEAPQHLRDLIEHSKTIRGVEALYRIIVSQQAGQTMSLTKLMKLHDNQYN